MQPKRNEIPKFLVVQTVLFAIMAMAMVQHASAQPSKMMRGRMQMAVLSLVLVGTADMPSSATTLLPAAEASAGVPVFFVLAYAGATSIDAKDAAGISVGQTLTISDLYNSETKTILAVTPEGVLTFGAPLANSYTPGSIKYSARTPWSTTTTTIPTTTDDAEQELMGVGEADTVDAATPLVTTNAPATDAEEAEEAEEAAEDVTNVRSDTIFPEAVAASTPAPPPMVSEEQIVVSQHSNHDRGKAGKVVKGKGSKDGKGTKDGKETKDGKDSHAKHGKSKKGSTAQLAGIATARKKKMNLIVGVVGVVCVALAVGVAGSAHVTGIGETSDNERPLLEKVAKSSPPVPASPTAQYSEEL